MKKQKTNAKCRQKNMCNLIVTFCSTEMTVQDVEKASMDNDEPLAVRKCINGVLWDQLLAHKQYLPCSGEMCRIGKLILRKTRIVIRKKAHRVLYLAHEGHLGITGTKQKLNL